MGRWRLPPEIDSHLAPSQGRNTHTQTHIGTCTHTHMLTQRHTGTQAHTGTHTYTHRHTHRHAHTHVLTQRHTGTTGTHRHTQACTHTHAHTVSTQVPQARTDHSVTASSTLVSTQQPVWFFQNWARSQHFVCQTLSYLGGNEGPYSDLPGKSRESAPRRPPACVLGPFTQPRRPLAGLRQSGPSPSGPGALERPVLPERSSLRPPQPLQVTGQRFTIFPIT